MVSCVGLNNKLINMDEIKVKFKIAGILAREEKTLLDRSKKLTDIFNILEKQCDIHVVSGSFFHDKEIIDACIDWCELVGLDSTNEDIMTAFCMGAKLSLSNNGWCNYH